MILTTLPEDILTTLPDSSRPSRFSGQGRDRESREIAYHGLVAVYGCGGLGVGGGGDKRRKEEL
ncbi:hypothetical protein Taro_003790 [Colocasia esculenta]|uniref:Uncharacterized protein n=1 Tax=Colocasia esculenta TaxID=4460 RepID=A0A843TSX1_COLES|nr:hypothetical protein [Colocasia esculenta]